MFEAFRGLAPTLLGDGAGVVFASLALHASTKLSPTLSHSTCDGGSQNCLARVRF